MTISTVFDVILGVAFVFFVFSTVASGVHELIARAMATRSKQLWRSLAALLDEDGSTGDEKKKKRERAATMALGLTGRRDLRPVRSGGSDTNSQKLFAHDLVAGLDDTTRFAKIRLSHIEPDVFSRALLDVVSGDKELDDTNAFKDAVNQLPDGRLKNELAAVARHAGDKIEDVRNDVGAWFDIRMQALSRAYRRRTRWWLFVIGIGVAIGFNVNAIHVTTEFYEDDAVRALVVAEAESLAADCEFTDGKPDADCETKIKAASEALDLPVWWDDTNVNFWTFVGWVIAGAAIAQGGPFWFDLLRRVAGFKKAAMST